MSKNFAYSLVATAPSPATSGTSLVVTAADGAKFPSTPFQATIWPVSSQPTTTNAEIVTVTGISTDTLTIVRATEGTTARSVIIGDQIAATITNNNLPTAGVLLNGTATDNDYSLRSSQALMALDHFESGATNVTEVPATSTLEVVSYVGGGMSGAVTDTNLQFGKIRARQGGSGTDWTASGTTTVDTNTTGIIIQCGSKANNASPTAYTFPYPYNYPPVVIGNVITASGANCYVTLQSITTTGFSCQVVTDAGVANTAQTVSWIAIGQ